MGQTLGQLTGRQREALGKLGIEAKLFPIRIGSLSDYVTAFHGVAAREMTYWFRGHGDAGWSLTPSALRYEDEEERTKALDLVRDFKRISEIKLPNPPRPDEELKWLQLAQHYGLPTRLLDWTRNAAVALYFACQNPKKNGLVFVLNPVDLNRQTAGEGRVFDGMHDASVIDAYFALGGRIDPEGPGTIAVNPVFNSERIVLQRGSFTLHGSREFHLTAKQAPSLVALPIISRSKQRLLKELEGVGVDEMSIFPEPEHLCSHLKRAAKLAR